jgi:hypothetical protein
MTTRNINRKTLLYIGAVIIIVVSLTIPTLIWLRDFIQVLLTKLTAINYQIMQLFKIL